MRNYIHKESSRSVVSDLAILHVIQSDKHGSISSKTFHNVPYILEKKYARRNTAFVIIKAANGRPLKNCRIESSGF